MGFYDTKENVDSYIKFTPSHDGAELVGVLDDVLPEESTVLELGIGPGKDFGLLSKRYQVTGSDASEEFLGRTRQRYPEADLMILDARTFDTDRCFDCIYSNKVLIHLDRDALSASLALQHQRLNENGLILHSFWHGSGEEAWGELFLHRYTEQVLAELLDGRYEIIEIRRHAKMTEGDSVYVLARKIG